MDKKSILITISILLVVLISGIGIGYLLFYNYENNFQNNNVNVSKDENKDSNVIIDDKNSEKIINLTNEAKKEINTNLEKFYFSTVNQYGYLDNTKGINIFDNDEERFNLTMYYIFNEEIWPNVNISNENYLCNADGDCKVLLTYVHKKCQEFFNKDFDEAKLANKYGDGYASIANGGGILAFMEVNEKKYNEKTNEYELEVNFIKDELIDEYHNNPSNSLVDRKAKIKYKLENNKKILISWVYTK